MRISFAKLGEEGCETCEEFHMSKHSHGHPVAVETFQAHIDDDSEPGKTCELCETWVKHVREANVSRRQSGGRCG